MKEEAKTFGKDFWFKWLQKAEKVDILYIQFMPVFSFSFLAVKFFRGKPNIALRMLLDSSHFRAVPANFSQPVLHKKNVQKEKKKNQEVKSRRCETFFLPRSGNMFHNSPELLVFSGATLKLLFTVSVYSVSHLHFSSDICILCSPSFLLLLPTVEIWGFLSALKINYLCRSSASSFSTLSSSA